MDQFWEGFWLGILSYLIFRNLLDMLKMYLLKRLIARVVDDIKTEQGEILLRLEKHGDIYYCYRKDTDEFIAQAATVEEIGDLFKKKYPHNDGRILREDTSGIL